MQDIVCGAQCAEAVFVTFHSSVVLAKLDADLSLLTLVCKTLVACDIMAIAQTTALGAIMQGLQKGTGRCGFLHTRNSSTSK